MLYQHGKEKIYFIWNPSPFSSTDQRIIPKSLVLEILSPYFFFDRDHPALFLVPFFADLPPINNF